MTKRVLVAFSGGVDSAMTALFLREQGYDVRAAMMTVRDESGRGCGAAGDGEAAARLAASLAIPFRVFDCSAGYGREVLARFRDEYLAGRTPNPCVECNPAVKFSLLPDMALAAGIAFDMFATGHYARIGERDGGPVLLRGVDPGKDQSYFLYRLPREVLARTMFPLGGMRKAEVRAEAARRGVAVHDKPDSQDFYGGEYAELLGVSDAEGDIVDGSGRVLGRHRGYWRFTPGQRKGLGVAYREPLYVIRVEPGENRVVVGTREEGLRRGCGATRLAFSLREPVVGEKVFGKLRSAQAPVAMTVTAFGDGRMEAKFAEPRQGVAPGQSLVIYEGDAVLGGGIITESFA